MRIQALILGAAVALTIAAPVGANDGTNPVQVAMKHSTTAAGAVSIAGMKFVPASLTVPVGTTVTWTSAGAPTHTSTSTATPPVWDSGNITGGKSFSHTFTTAGTFAYHCKIHTFMHGTIVVTAMKKMKM